jgi:hypothetical protein
MEFDITMVTMDTILSVFKNYNEEKRLKDIKGAVAMMVSPGDLFVDPETEELIYEKIDDLIKADKELEDNSYLIYKKGGKYRKRRNRKSLDDPQLRTTNTDYIGRAGECAVMSELLFRGYNANRMMIDDGVDIIASKDNIYYYVQVKTTTVKNDRIYCRIGLDSFDRYISNQIRYIIVARFKEKDIDRNMFFMFTPQEIERACYDKCLLKGVDGYSIKIKFNERNREPILYDDKEMNISWNMNRFDL